MQLISCLAHLTISSILRRPDANSSALALNSAACVLMRAARQRPRLCCRLPAGCCCTVTNQRGKNDQRPEAPKLKLVATPVQRQQAGGGGGGAPGAAAATRNATNWIMFVSSSITNDALPALQPGSETWRAILS